MRAPSLRDYHPDVLAAIGGLEVVEMPVPDRVAVRCW